VATGACEPISDLAIIVNDNLAELHWVAPANSTPNHYEIYYNYKSVGTTTNTTFSIPITANNNDFCVYAVYDDCLVPECIYFIANDSTTTVKEIVNNMLVTVYPNPTTGLIRIEMWDMRYEMWDMRYEIYDVYGRNVSNLKAQIPNPKINISHLPAGIYFLKIQTEQGTIVQKVVKQ
jgi:hypothetical protein